MPATIIAIDDSVEVLLSIGATLEPDYDIRVATTGEEGLTLIAELRPDLILLDIMMPGIDGFEVCRRLQRDHELQSIPVIFLTAMGRQEDEVRCFEAGGVDFVVKPFSPIVLRSRVETQVRLKQQTDMLRYQATRDGLTGLFNRREFNVQFDRDWRSCQRDSKRLSLLLIDIDHFKLYNDTYGHQKGDLCLQQVASVIRKQLKRGGDRAARYGGEEFVCLLPQTGETSALYIAEIIQAAVEQLAIVHESSPIAETVTVSIGGACERAFIGKSGDQLLKRADEALYQAKEQGRNRVVFLEDEDKKEEGTI